MTRHEGALAGDVALVAGAGGAFGRAAVSVLSEAGATVVLTGRRREPLEIAAAQVRRSRATVVPTDITDPGQVERLVDTTIDLHGSIDILVNLAGRLDPVGVPLWDADPAEWRRTMASNVTGVFLTCRAVIPHMLSQGRGRILNLSTPAASVPIPQLGAYCVSKAAVAQLTQVLALELEETGVSVSDFIPGATDTPSFHASLAAMGSRVPARLLREPVDALAMLVPIAAADADEVNGRVLRRDEPWVRSRLARRAPAGVGR